MYFAPTTPSTSSSPSPSPILLTTSSVSSSTESIYREINDSERYVTSNSVPISGYDELINSIL
jgi:hypothetical protein